MVDHGVRDLWTIPLAGARRGRRRARCSGCPPLRFSRRRTSRSRPSRSRLASSASLKRFAHFTGGDDRQEPAAACTPQLGLHHEPVALALPRLWTVALVLFVVAWLLVRGRLGRALRAVRDSEIAATRRTAISAVLQDARLRHLGVLRRRRGRALRDRRRVRQSGHVPDRRSRSCC